MASKASDKAAKRARVQAIDKLERERTVRLKAARLDDAGNPRDVLADFGAFAQYHRNGYAASLSFAAPDTPAWTPDVAAFVLDLTRSNMQALYEAAADWGWKEGKKRAELNDGDMRYVLCRQTDTGRLVGFAGFRFVAEGDAEVLYLYELQLDGSAQRKGLGRHLMQLLELMARKQGMQWYVRGLPPPASRRLRLPRGGSRRPR
jgi:ribosomal protein S18 acetylase RimI-like enzyme